MFIAAFPRQAARSHIRCLTCAILATLAFVGCTTTSERSVDRTSWEDVLRIDPAKTKKPADLDGRLTPTGKEGETNVDEAQAGTAADASQDPSRFPSRNMDEETPERPNVPALDSPAYDIVDDLDLEEPEELLSEDESDALQFNGEDLSTVVQSFAKALGLKYYIDPAVSGTVTMSFTGDLTRREAWELFVRLLWFHDAYVTLDNGFIRVMNMEKMPREQRIFESIEDAREKGVPRPNVVVRLLRFVNVDAAEMVPLLSPHLSPKASITPIKHLNGLLVIETPTNLEKLLTLATRLDMIGEQEWPQDSIVCHYVDVSVLTDELKLILPVLGFRVSTGDKADGQSIRIVPIERLQVIIVSAPARELVEEVRRWIDVLDREASEEQEQVFFYKARQTKAEDLAQAIEFFFNTTAARTSRSSSSSSSGDAADADAAPKLTPARTTTRRSTSSGADDSETIRRMVFDVPVNVFVDAKHNQLVLRTTTRAFNMILAILEKLDTAPLQVLIQMTIAEIQLNRTTRLGFKYSALQAIRSGKYEFKSMFDYDVNSGINPADGLNLLLTKTTDPTNVFAFVEAIAGEGNTRVLFSPQVLAISDEEAVINVGDKVPIITQENNSNDTSNITREIQYEDTGIIMTVTPHVTASKMVTLKIKQEVSDAVKTTSSNIDSPTIQSRKVETSLLIEDNSTILLGGLIRSRDVHSNSGIPLLKDIPFLGRFFSLRTSDEQRQELLILMTVNVMEADSNVERLARRYKDALKAIRQKLNVTYDEKHDGKPSRNE